VDYVIEIPCIDILDMSVVIKSVVVHLSDTGLAEKNEYWSRIRTSST
jgi:hypothetical protein